MGGAWGAAYAPYMPACDCHAYAAHCALYACHWALLSMPAQTFSSSPICAPCCITKHMTQKKLVVFDAVNDTSTTSRSLQ